MAEKKERASWSGKWAFILAAAASAVGLGNMWRFPYLAAKYGGGTFLLTYVVLVFTFGASMLLLETALGRKTGMSAIGAFKHYGKKYAFIGILTSAIPFIIVPYYCIIGGWVTKFMVGYIVDGPLAIAAEGGSYFVDFVYGDMSTYFWMLVFMAITFVVVAKGVKGGIEKVNLVMMPALIILAVGIAVYTMTMPGALDGVMYYLKPDFSKFSPELVIGALGQMFYSLSLAMGIMITYGSYVKKDTDLNKAVNQIELFDTIVAFLAGMMIIPAVYTFMGREGMSASGPALMFVALPKVFAEMGSVIGTVVGITFFVTVAFAALTSSVSIMEAVVSSVMDRFRMDRKKAAVIVALITLVLGVVVCLGYNLFYFEAVLPNTPAGKNAQILDIMDYISNYVLMPVISITTCIFIGWVVKPKTIIDEVTLGGRKFGREKLYVVMIKFITPAMLFLLLLQALGVIRF